ncbi:sigma-70 family RNA polymerase sigma factor [Flavivirga sp. MEBiC05379]|uniref:Sigma-70 family RNA polymerase sigma factor n=1 Tax=Flavivirga spongiicola TaxID=421621 RepID=A0ABU7XNG9_9FLAO|nr:sigma-70 family RNA polymerase sigma factor [Flavivirga sp. MEBiC05379]MDO5977307.1 sigma-70 family RNA polymerase sigma factor [Flavivirga sp. MEBiC05379]
MLWKKLKAGDTKALGDLYDLFIDILFAYGIQLSSDKAYVMDCIHDLFLDLYKYRKKLAFTTNVKYYLLRSLKNKILKAEKGKLIYLSEEAFHIKNDKQNYSESFENKMIEKEFLDERLVKLSNAITFLSKKQRQGLFLRFTEEREYENIAQIMNVSVETSRTIIYRAIKVLRKHLTMLIIFYQNIFF